MGATGCIRSWRLARIAGPDRASWTATAFRVQWRQLEQAGYISGPCARPALRNRRPWSCPAPARHLPPLECPVPCLRGWRQGRVANSQGVVQLHAHPGCLKHYWLVIRQGPRRQLASVGCQGNRRPAGCRRLASTGRQCNVWVSHWMGRTGKAKLCLPRMTARLRIATAPCAPPAPHPATVPAGTVILPTSRANHPATRTRTSPPWRSRWNSPGSPPALSEPSGVGNLTGAKTDSGSAPEFEFRYLPGHGTGLHRGIFVQTPLSRGRQGQGLLEAVPRAATHSCPGLDAIALPVCRHDGRPGWRGVQSHADPVPLRANATRTPPHGRHAGRIVAGSSPRQLGARQRCARSACPRFGGRTATAAARRPRFVVRLAGNRRLAAGVGHRSGGNRWLEECGRGCACVASVPGAIPPRPTVPFHGR